MSRIYRLILPAEAVHLVYPCLQESNTYLEFTSLGTLDTGFLPQFWAYGDDRNHLAEQLSTTPALCAISRQAVCPDRVHYAVEWDPNADAVTHLERLRTLFDDLEATLLFGRITPAQWVFICQFPTQEAVLQCYVECEYSECEFTQRTDLGFPEQPLSHK